MADPDMSMTSLQRQLASFERQGLTPSTRYRREPVEEIHEWIPADEGRRKIMVFHLADKKRKYQPGDLVQYIADCPQCRKRKAITAESRYMGGYTKQVFDLGAPQLCESCEEHPVELDLNEAVA